MKGYNLLQVAHTAVKEYREDIYGSETKTDDVGARIMARMGFLHERVGEEFSIQPVHIASPDESVIRLMTRDLMKVGKDITRRKNQLISFPDFKTCFNSEITGITAQELRNASVNDIAEVFHRSQSYRHEKPDDNTCSKFRGCSVGEPSCLATIVAA